MGILASDGLGERIVILVYALAVIGALTVLAFVVLLFRIILTDEVGQS